MFSDDLYRKTGKNERNTLEKLRRFFRPEQNQMRKPQWACFIE